MSSDGGQSSRGKKILDMLSQPRNMLMGLLVVVIIGAFSAVMTAKETCNADSLDTAKWFLIASVAIPVAVLALGGLGYGSWLATGWVEGKAASRLSADQLTKLLEAKNGMGPDNME